MPDEKVTPQTNMDPILGKMALDWGLINPDQLRLALTEQSRDLEKGEVPRRLGEILIANGFITKTQLDALLEAQRARTKDPAAMINQEMRLGQFLIQHGLATPRQINECLREQMNALEIGRRMPTLVEMLAEKGYAKFDDIQRVLEEQRQTTLVCVLCGRRYPVTGFDPTKAYRCRDCRGDLVNTIGVLSSVEDDSGIILPFGASPLPLPRPLTPSAMGPFGVARVDGGSSAAAVPPTSSMQPSAGAQAVIPAPVPFGKYLLLREIGRGGMAVVYEARDTTLDRRVALKMMIDNPYQDPTEAAQDVERFLREAKFCASLSKHPNIVSVFEAGLIEGRRFIVMEYIDGFPMSKWRRMGSLSVRQQVAMLRDVALAVHFAHENGVVHRDLKPQNILVDEDRRPHVTDFGLAKAVGPNVSASLTAPRMTVGTPQYMSPEQAKGLKSVDRRTDVYAMGVMLYEILTGRPPFPGVTPIEILMKVVNNPILPPSQVMRGGHPLLDKSIEAITMKALEKDARDRYQTARIFAEDLTRWLKGEEVKPLMMTRFRWDFLSDWGVRAGVVAGAAIVLLAVVLTLSGSNSEGPDKALKYAARLMQSGAYDEALYEYKRIQERFPSCNEAAIGKKNAMEGIARREESARVSVRESIRREVEEKNRQEIERLERQKEELRREVERSRREADAMAGRAYLSLSGHTNAILALAFQAGGSLMASGGFDNSIRVWDAKTGHERKTLTGHSGGVLSLAFSPDGSSLVSGSLDRTIRIWSPADGATRHSWKAHDLGVTSVAFSPDGKYIASAGLDKAVHLWDAEVGRSYRMLAGHGDVVWCVAFSPDGRLLASAGADGRIFLWEVASGIEKRKWKGHSTSVRSIAFHPDGGMLVSGGDDRVVMLWDLKTGNLSRTFPGHAEPVRCVAFSPDGRHVASGSQDKSVKLWDVTTGVAGRTFLGHSGGVWSIAFSAKDDILASGAGDIRFESDGRVSVWGNIDSVIRYWRVR